MNDVNTILLAATLVSLALAAAACAIAWRLVRQERLRSAARVAALAAEIRPAADTPGASDRPAAQGSGAVPHDLFATPSPPGAPPWRRGLAVAAGAGTIGLTALLATAGGGDDRAGDAAATAPKPPARAIELVSLTHERDLDNLVVRGIVRSPSDAAVPHELVAVVLLFSSDGGFVASARAPIDTAALGAGGEAAFSVSVPADDVARYRVSFRAADQVLPHVDARKM